ncbi:hypothetical protein, partial [Sinorhizobium fredii]|uniref:hypothetical protein n=1 Tax=Rhizobium fredii TaxID=380 RepID=UPI001AEC07B7
KGQVALVGRQQKRPGLTRPSCTQCQYIRGQWRSEICVTADHVDCVTHLPDNVTVVKFARRRQAKRFPGQFSGVLVKPATH